MWPKMGPIKFFPEGQPGHLTACTGASAPDMGKCRQLVILHVYPCHSHVITMGAPSEHGMQLVAPRSQLPWQRMVPGHRCLDHLSNCTHTWAAQVGAWQSGGLFLLNNLVILYKEGKGYYGNSAFLAPYGPKWVQKNFFP